MNLFTYKMSDIVADEIKRGVELNGETVEYAFDLNEFFATDDKGNFEHESSVDKFLDALTTQKKFPFSTAELRDELRHTFWLLERVASAKALAAKLKAHPTFASTKLFWRRATGNLTTSTRLPKPSTKLSTRLQVTGGQSRCRSGS